MVNTDDETKRVEEVLMKKITCVEQNLKANIDFLTAMKDDVNVETNVCLKNLEKRREEVKNEVDKQFDKMKKEVVDQKKESNSSLEKEIVVLNEYFNLLGSIKLDAEYHNSFNDLMDKMDILQEVKETVNQHISGERTHGYITFTPVPFAPMHFGKTEHKQIIRTLTKIDEGADLVERLLRKITDASQLKCTGENKHILDYLREKSFWDSHYCLQELFGFRSQLTN